MVNAPLIKAMLLPSLLPDSKFLKQLLNMKSVPPKNLRSSKKVECSNEQNNKHLKKKNSFYHTNTLLNFFSS